jgi:hypothetical protein
MRILIFADSSLITFVAGLGRPQTITCWVLLRNPNKSFFKKKTLNELFLAQVLKKNRDCLSILLNQTKIYDPKFYLQVYSF